MTPLPLAAVEAEAHAGALSVWSLLAGVALLGVNAFFVGAEIALLAVRRARIEERAEQGDRRAVVALNALRELSVTFSGAQLGITMASLGLGAVAEPAVVALLDSWFEVTPLSTTSRAAIAFGLGLAIVVFLHMVIGEMAPKNWALSSAEEAALRLARPFRLFVRVLRPVILLLNATANLLVRLVGVQPRDELGLVHTADELALLVRESHREGHLPPQDARVMAAALRLSEIDAEAAMTPRTDLVALADDQPALRVLDLAAETGYTRVPVYHGDLDGVVGLVHVKDVLVRDVAELEQLTVGDLIRPVVAVPERRDLEHLLKDMRRDRAHAVLVVDEYGGTSGLISLEDILEELVGEIADEFDEPDPDVQPLPGRRWRVRGTARRDEVARLVGLTLPETDSETVSGYLTDTLGRLVETGDEVEVDGWKLVVRSVEGRRAGEVEIVAPRAT